MTKNATTLLLALAFAAPAFAQDAPADAPVAETAAEATPAPEATPAAEAAPMAAPMADEAPAVAAPLNPAITALVGTPEPGKGLVVFYRPAKFVGGGAGIKVHEGEIVHGKLGNGTWLAVNLEPGAHQFVAKGENTDETPLEVEAGETYFMSAAISMGIVAGRKNFALTDAAAFEAVMGKLKPAKPLKK